MERIVTERTHSDSEKIGDEYMCRAIPHKIF